MLGVVIIAGLCLVLQAYDHEKMPQFGEVIGTTLTLNTVVALISISAKAALLLPVAEYVSMLKWIWFSDHYRALSDLSTFDQARRRILCGFDLSRETRLRYYIRLTSAESVLTS